MHRPGLTLAATLGAAFAITAAAGAAPAFTGNVCKLLSAKQVTAIGVSSKCTSTKPSKGPGSTMYVGNWAGKKPTSLALQITVSSYSDSGLLKLATNNLMQGLSGTPKKVSGIGSAAYEATSTGVVDLHVAVGKYIVYLGLNNVTKSAPALTALEAIAKDATAGL